MICKVSEKMKNRVILFGAGALGKELLNKINKNEVVYFVDNNPSIIGSRVDDVEVISVSQLKRIEDLSDYVIVITSEKYFKEINEQLNSLGIYNCVSANCYLIASKFQGNEGKKRIILANTHMGTNMGDHFITISELLFFDKYFPEYAVIELTADEIEEKFEIVKEYIDKEDIIAVSGGGYMGSLWLIYGEYNVRHIVEELPDNKVIVLPQSIYFENTVEGKKQLQKSRNIYNAHKNLTICIREPEQWNYVRGLFSENVNVKIYPDMVLSMDRQVRFSVRDKVGICFRQDKEAMISSDEKEHITEMITDTIYSFDMHVDKPITGLQRGKCIREYIDMVSGFKYVITDRLHCMLLCLITGTPCIAFNNMTGKISSVYQWIQDCEYIHIVSSVEEVEKQIEVNSNNVETIFYDWSDLYKKFEELSGEFR